MTIASILVGLQRTHKRVKLFVAPWKKTQYGCGNATQAGMQAAVNRRGESQISRADVMAVWRIRVNPAYNQQQHRFRPLPFYLLSGKGEINGSAVGSHCSRRLSVTLCARIVPLGALQLDWSIGSYGYVSAVDLYDAMVLQCSPL